jgi:hypothetical protein
MGISKREMELSTALMTLQRQYNEMYEYKEGWMKLARERLLEIERLQSDVRSLINAIEESEANEYPASMPMKNLSGETASIILFRD